MNYLEHILILISEISIIFHMYFGRFFERHLSHVVSTERFYDQDTDKGQKSTNVYYY